MFDRRIILVFVGHSMIALPCRDVLVQSIDVVKPFDFLFLWEKIVLLWWWMCYCPSELQYSVFESVDCLSSTSITMYVQKLTSASQYLYHFGVGLDKS